jgi:hypothetical protein
MYGNIQASHHLMRGEPAVRAALFGGCGFVFNVDEHRGSVSWLSSSEASATVIN